jgi:hypothetical protein
VNAERETRNAEQQGQPRDLRERTKAFAVDVVRFVQNLGIVEEEADESAFWLELLAEAGLTRSEDARRLRAEADQLVAITIASVRTARGPRIKVPRSAFRVPR